MKSINLSLFPFLLCLFFSCSQRQDKRIDKSETVNPSATDISEKPFVSDSIYEFELDSSAVDTFKLVSHSWYFYYCFGKFSNPTQLKIHFKPTFAVEEEVHPSQIDLQENDTLYRVKLKNGFIKYFSTSRSEDEKNTEMDVVSAKITSSDIAMTNGLKVGLTRDEVKNILFRQGEPKGLRGYSNLSIATVFQGMWVHLHFDQSKLTSIIIDTDYQLNKE